LVPKPAGGFQHFTSTSAQFWKRSLRYIVALTQMVLLCSGWLENLHVIDYAGVRLSPKLQVIATLAKIIRLDRISD
jgi:hypothetical protein